MIIFEKKLNPLKSILSLLFSLFSLFLAITSFAQEAEKQIIIEYSGFLSSKEKTHDGGIVFLRDKKNKSTLFMMELICIVTKPFCTKTKTS